MVRDLTARYRFALLVSKSAPRLGFFENFYPSTSNAFHPARR